MAKSKKPEDGHPFANYATRIGIPQENQAQFFAHIDMMPALFSRPSVKTKQMRSVAKAIREVLKRIWDLDDDAKHLLNKLMEHPKYRVDPVLIKHDKFKNAPTLFRFWLDITRAMEPTLILFSGPFPFGRPIGPRSRGRPYGSTKKEDKPLEWAAQELMRAIEKAGGKLTIDKNHHRGTVADGLNLLRTQLPPGIIPGKLPWSKLARLLTRFKRRRKSPDH